MSRLELFLFGPPRLIYKGRPVRLKLRKTLALLAYLAVTRQPHSRDALVTLLWPEESPSVGRANLRRHLYRLNRTLDEDLLSSGGEQTISLKPQAGLWLDIEMYRQQVAHLPNPGPAGEIDPVTLSHLIEATKLYTDDFMAGFTLPDSPAFDDWQFYQREELRRSLGQVLIQLSDFYQRQGAYDQAIPHARRWLFLDPLHEPAHYQLIALYAQAGQRTAALRQYEECLRLLDSELGVAPEEATTAIYRAIRARQFPAPPQQLENDTSHAPIVSPPPPETQPALPTPRSALHNLPEQRTAFIGRRAEIEELKKLLLDPEVRLVTVTGPGGIGKTRLALQVAVEVADRFVSGVHFVPLRALAPSQPLAPKIADALQIVLSGQTPAEEQLVTCLQEKELLLLLDNFEHLLEQVDLLSNLLHATPYVKLLVTSTEVLSLQEEWVYRVEGMKAPAQEGEANAGAYEAVQFFTERARRVNPHFSLDNEMPAVIQICHLVDGIPLALELAASWAGTIDCETIAAGIQNNIDFLASTLRNMPERHRSMRAVFDQTWNYLSPQERDAFKQLSVFRGTFRLRAAEQIAAAALPTLSALINKSLLQWDGRGCYHLHGLLRQYGEEHLMASADGVDVRERHCSYFANFLRQRLDDIHAGRQVDAMREMEGELDNLEAAWQWAVEHTRVEEIRQSLHALAWFWHYGSRFQEGADSLHTAIRKLEAGKPTAGTAVALAEVCVQYGWLCIRLGRLEEAETSLDQAQALYERLGAAPISDGGSDPLGALAMLAILKGEFARGTGLLEEARREQEARGDRRNLATTYYVQTSALVAQGRYQAAEESALEAHRLAQELNDRWSQAYTLNDLGLVTYLLGKYEKARQHYRASYAIRRQYNDREGMAVALRHLGQIALHAQESEEAEQLFRESLRLYDGTGDLGGLAATLDALGNVACARGNYLDAREHLLRALQIAMRSRLRSLAFSILTSVAELLLQCGQSQQALTTLAFVHSQPSAASDVKARAKRLLDTHADVVPPDVYADAIAQGENRDLELTATDLQTSLVTLEDRQSVVPTTPASPAPDAKQTLVEPLTPRELDVLHLMADGLTNQQIADRLVVALGTVKAYTSRIYGKLGVQNRVSAIAQARRHSLL